MQAMMMWKQLSTMKPENESNQPQKLYPTGVVELSRFGVLAHFQGGATAALPITRENTCRQGPVPLEYRYRNCYKIQS